MGWREIMAGPQAEEVEADGEGSPYAGPPVERAPRERPTGKANRLAVTALICSLAVPFLLVAGILGTVFGFVALDEIEESEGKEWRSGRLDSGFSTSPCPVLLLPGL